MQNRSGATKLVNGFRWPAYDEACAAVVFNSIPDLDRAVARCSQRRTAIQAGGNCGVWARHLSGLFSSVWTWEPDPLNFNCLEFNAAAHKNIVCVNAALGDEAGWTTMHEPEESNCGALQIGTTFSVDRPAEGGIQVVRLDDYKEQIGHVDLIYLDLEGFELNAISGATDLINRCQPIIAVEDKGLSERYGALKGDVLRCIETTFNYEICDQYARDYVLRPMTD